LDRARAVERVVGGGDVERGLGPGQSRAVACRVVLVGERLAAGGGAGQAPGRIPHVGHGVAVVGVPGLGTTAQQVVGEGDVVRGRGVAAAGQAVQVVVGEGDA